MRGIPYPSSNYHPIPNNFCEIIEDLTKSEIQALHYIMRHTWGFPKDGRQEPKRLSFDDFLFGREVRDRKTGKLRRMDSGCGITAKSTLSRALKALAVKHEKILILEDRRDLGRVKKRYRVRLPEDEDLPSIMDLNEYQIERHEQLKDGFPHGTQSSSKVYKGLRVGNPNREKETIEVNHWEDEFPPGYFDNKVEEKK